MEVKKLRGTKALALAVDDIAGHGLQRQVMLESEWLHPLITPQLQVCGEPVEVDFTAERIGNGVNVRASARFVAEFECSRCAERGRIDQLVRWRALYSTVDEGRVKLGAGAASQGDEGELEIWPLVDQKIDLEPAVAEHVVFALPLCPLCSPDCRGLCAGCGANLNVADCTCPPKTVDPRWSKLQTLREKLN